MRKIIFPLFLFISFGYLSAVNAKDLYYVMNPEGDLSEHLQPILKNVIVETVNSQLNTQTTNIQTELNFILALSVEKLDHDYLVSMKKCTEWMRPESCKYFASLKISSLDEIDNTTKRLTLLAISNEQPSSNATLDNADDIKLKSGSVRRYFKVGLGGSVLSSLGADQAINYSILIGWSALIKKQFAVNIDSMLLFDGNSNTMFTIGLGPQYYFLAESDIDPYIKATISYYIASNKDDTNGGIAFGGGAGVTFFKTSDVNMFLEGGGVFGTRQLSNKTPAAGYFLVGVAF